MKTKRYRIGDVPYFTRQGYLATEGDIVEIPANEKPAPSWTEVVEGDTAAPAPAKAEETIEVGGVVIKKGGRAADKDI